MELVADDRRGDRSRSDGNIKLVADGVEGGLSGVLVVALLVLALEDLVWCLGDCLRFMEISEEMVDERSLRFLNGGSLKESDLDSDRRRLAVLNVTGKLLIFLAESNTKLITR